MAKEKEYTRLSGIVTFRSHLWLGKDHLLCVDSMGFTEDYKRFYFRDIQAIVIRKTDVGRIWNFVLGMLTLPPLIAGLTTSGGWRIFWLILFAFVLLFVLINTLYGPTCTCHLRTAVQTEELPSLKRLPRARKVLARLRPLIAAAQGELNPEEIPMHMAELAKPPMAATPTASASLPLDPIFQPPTDPGRLEHP